MAKNPSCPECGPEFLLKTLYTRNYPEKRNALKNSIPIKIIKDNKLIIGLNLEDPLYCDNCNTIFMRKDIKQIRNVINSIKNK